MNQGGLYFGEHYGFEVAGWDLDECWVKDFGPLHGHAGQMEGGLYGEFGDDDGGETVRSEEYKRFHE